MYTTKTEAIEAATQMVKETVRQPADVNVYAADGVFKVLRATVTVPETYKLVANVSAPVVVRDLS